VIGGRGQGSWQRRQQQRQQQQRPQNRQHPPTRPPAHPQRNYRTFLLFIYGSTVYVMWTFAISLWSFWVKAGDLERAAPGKPVDILSVIGEGPVWEGGGGLRGWKRGGRLGRCS
jgi:hypothetical protein